ncbi:FISUMP domain-containing protein [Fibrobacter sp.]|uniref:FISUMP domain-containing protein n=1 Tax=Fibrobacter sp. TaxID=35828 RepID=UPI00389049A0
MKMRFGILGALCVASMFYAGCGDSDKKLANGYTEEQNAELVKYEKILKTWEPSVEVDSTKCTWESEYGESAYWYEIDFTSSGKKYASEKETYYGEYSVYVYKKENGVRLFLSNADKVGYFTIMLNRDSKKAVEVDQIDFQYRNDHGISACRADSSKFVEECEDGNGKVKDWIGAETCDVLHLTCTKKFEPEVIAIEYLQEIAEKLTELGEDEYTSAGYWDGEIKPAGPIDEDPEEPADTAKVDTSRVDTTAADTTTKIDTTKTDTSTVDTTAADTAKVDTALVDTSSVDTSTVDTSTVDTSTVDTSTVDPELDDTKLVDARDGHVYRTVQIGDQVWMAENLNYAYLQPTTLWDSTSFCYKNDPKNCEIYGRLYSWSAAMDSAGLFSDDAKGCGLDGVCLPPRNVQGVCPEGWRIPNYDEWNALVEFVDPNNNGSLAGVRLKAEEDGGTDDYGFGLRIAGRHIEFDQSDNSYSQLGSQTMYHSTVESDSSSAFGFTFFGDYDYVGVVVPYSKYMAYPVRCIKGEASAYPIGALDPATVETGEFMDARDERVYKTTTIGKLTWMAENLNYNAEGSVCYGDDDNCDTYGRLYLGEVANEVCPSGWHLPSRAEFDTLYVSIGISYAPLKTTSGWSATLGNGTDIYEFSLLPNGRGRVSEETISYSELGENAYLWTSTDNGRGDSFSFVFQLTRNSSGQFSWTSISLSNYAGVRCVKN